MGVNYEAECCCLICIVCDARSSARTPFLCECMQPESHDVVQLFAVFRWVPNGALHMSHKSQATCRALTRVYDTMTNDMPKRADDEKEILEVIDDGMGGSPVPHLVIDYVPRGTIHTKGLLHRAVHCFVFDCDKRLLLQRRSFRKRIGAGLWDLSLAEHLSPGESFSAACKRGLAEELGIRSCVTEGEITVQGPLTPPYRRRLEQEGFIDNEIVQGFMVMDYKGPLDVCQAEVEEVEWQPFETVVRDIAASPDRYTPWLREHLAHAQVALLGTLNPELIAR